MTASTFPAFKRLSVDHLFKGQSRIAWELNRQLVDPGVYWFQLQVGRAATPGATDWLDVGSEVADVPYLTDSSERLYGKNPETYYRVRLRTDEAVYFSEPAPIRGRLDLRDWLIVQEILRKEMLRHSKQTSNTGYLLRRKREHDTAVAARAEAYDTLTNQVIQSYGRPDEADDDFGTGLVGGYYAAVPCVFFDMSVEKKTIDRADPTQGTSRDDRRQARCIAIPFLDKDDVWVDKYSDERYRIKTPTVAAHHHNVPIVLNVELVLAAYTDPIYRVPLTSQLEDVGTGTGAIAVNHDTGGVDELRYAKDDGTGVPGTVTAFLTTDYDAGNRTAEYVKGSTTLDDDGRWTASLNLATGSYVLVFLSEGYYGPDLVTLEI